MNRADHSVWTRDLLPWQFMRWALFGAGLSLALYLPYRYATNPPALPTLYAFLLPLSPVLAIGGMTFAVAPGLSFRLSHLTRVGIAALAVLWCVVGLGCVPSLTLKIASAPAAGLLATFQMLAQHVFLPGVVSAFALKPDRAHAWFDLSGPAIETAEDTVAIASQLHV